MHTMSSTLTLTHTYPQTDAYECVVVRVLVYKVEKSKNLENKNVQLQLIYIYTYITQHIFTCCTNTQTPPHCIQYMHNENVNLSDVLRILVIIMLCAANAKCRE